MKDNSRVRRYPISELALLAFFTTSNEIHARVIDGFPKDASIIRHYYDRTTHLYFLVVQSAEFPPVEHGKEIPIHGINVETIGSPSAADLDAHAEELRAKEATA